MPKKDKIQNDTGNAVEAPAASDLHSVRPQSEGAAATPPVRDSFRLYFMIFWGLIILAIAVAWSLAFIMPGVSESVIERWIMAALSAALAVFLYVYK